MVGGRLPCGALVTVLLAFLQKVAGIDALERVCERDDEGSGGHILDTLVFHVSAVSSRHTSMLWLGGAGDLGRAL